jgi:lysophospholipase L1-like esterase
MGVRTSANIPVAAGFAVLVALAPVAVVSAPSPQDTAPRFELVDGDCVALIGGTFIEREQRYGFLELALQARWPDRRLLFRNLGWSGDDVTGESRLYFGTYRGTSTRLEGLDHLFKTLELFRPTVAFVAYGANEAFEGEAGLARFVAGYGRLLDRLDATGARIVLLSPLRHEALGGPLPDPAAINRNLELYTAAIRKLAETRRYRFVDLFHGLERFKRPGLEATDNGMHLTETGYLVAAAAIESGLGLEPSPLVKSALDKRNGPRLSPEAEALRRLIVEKDRLFFHRYRPTNDTYLRGFREYEQGNNAVEIPRFDPLVDEHDREIRTRKLRVGGAGVAAPPRSQGARP